MNDRHNSYPETMAYLYERLPMFSRQGKAAMKPNLTNTISSRIFHIQLNFEILHMYTISQRFQNIEN